MGITWFCRGSKHAPVVHPSANLGEDTLIDCQGQVTIGPLVFFGHRCMVLTGGHDPLQYGQARRASRQNRPVTIEEGAWIASGAIINPGVRIGKHAVVAPGAVVFRNVTDYGCVWGNPAYLVKRVRPRGVGGGEGIPAHRDAGCTWDDMVDPMGWLAWFVFRVRVTLGCVQRPRWSSG